MRKLIAIELVGFSFLFLTASVFASSTTTTTATTGNITQVQNFIQNVIQVLVTLAGLVAAGFFVVGGFGYITSSGNPEHLDRSKKTIIYSALGLAIAIAAFVLSSIVTQMATTAFGATK